MDNLLRSEENINLIWQYTHPDYRGTQFGNKTVLFNQKGATAISLIADLPEDVYLDKLCYAKKQKLREIASQKLNSIYQKFDLEESFNSTNQWRDSMQEVFEFVKWLKGEGFANRFIHEVRTKYIVFANGTDSDGVKIIEGVEEVSSPVSGATVLELTIQRPNMKVNRYFKCHGKELALMYQSGLSNPYVTHCEII